MFLLPDNLSDDPFPLPDGLSNDRSFLSDDMICLFINLFCPFSDLLHLSKEDENIFKKERYDLSLFIDIFHLNILPII
jgi:hypothetical protein